MADPDDVHAAGGIIARNVGGEIEVVVIHRDRYDDWSFPKGKLDPDETFEAGAIREVAEETGMVVTLGDELPAVRYQDRHQRPKLVRYWIMEVVDEHGAEADDEADEIRWLPIPEASELLTYPRDVELLQAFAACSPPVHLR